MLTSQITSISVGNSQEVRGYHCYTVSISRIRDYERLFKIICIEVIFGFETIKGLLIE